MDIQIYNTNNRQQVCIPEDNTPAQQLLDELKTRRIAFTIDEKNFADKTSYTVQSVDAQGKELAKYEVSLNSVSFHCLLIKGLKNEDPGALYYLAHGTLGNRYAHGVKLPNALQFLSSRSFLYVLDFTLRAMAKDPTHKSGHYILDWASTVPSQYRFTDNEADNQLVLQELYKSDTPSHFLIASLVYLYGSIGNDVDLNKAYEGLTKYAKFALMRYDSNPKNYHDELLFLLEKLGTLFEKKTKNNEILVIEKEVWKTIFSIKPKLESNPFGVVQLRSVEDLICYIKPQNSSVKYSNLATFIELGKKAMNRFHTNPNLYQNSIPVIANNLRSVLETYKDNLPQAIKQEAEKTLSDLENFTIENNNNA